MKVNCKLKVTSKENINALPNAWSKQDYLNILDLLGFSETLEDAEIEEMTLMAIADNSPEESAEILLQYRLSEHLSEGQIQQLSHEMQEDKLSEEYPDIFLQHELFNVNQLLFKSFNGRFPNCHAIGLTFNLVVKPPVNFEDEEWQNEIILKALLPAMGDNSLIQRLYQEEVEGSKKFDDADGIIWKKSIEKQADGSFNINIFSSEYWLHDIPSSCEYDTSFKLIEIENADS